MSGHPFWQLYLARLREFHREPEVIFWMFGFPVLLTVALGFAFRSKPADDIISVAVLSGPRASQTVEALSVEGRLKAQLLSEPDAKAALRMGRVALIVEPGDPPVLRFDPTRPDSAIARRAVDDALQRAAGRIDPVKLTLAETSEPGGRYIDFLVPGLMGMNIMGGGMWGVGFVLVDMRMRKLLKRLVATPMRRSHFLGAMMASRMSMVLIELGLILMFGVWVFSVPVRGSWLAVTLLVILGSFAFCGMGLLVASRTDKIETASGLMNLVMMPMWVVSGIFFSAERFPAMLQPLIKALPLTALNDALRAVILEGASLSAQAGRLTVLLAWGVVSFVVALRIFRWT
ncbi:MAG: ABC transporter permease [Acidobacteriota bacterium]